MPNTAKPVTAFTSTNVDTILAECAAALEAVAAKHGLSLQRKNCSYRTTEMPVAFKLAVQATDHDGKTVTPEAKAFLERAKVLGFKASDLNREFPFQGKTLRLTGYNPRARKFKMIVEEVNSGNEYTLEVAAVERGFKAA